MHADPIAFNRRARCASSKALSRSIIEFTRGPAAQPTIDHAPLSPDELSLVSH
ncbi:hypothetical protein C4K09_5228 [Pseudomonas chlororaphis subsp. aureofaciens]|nr:hypothetical protein C4K09_5228 [Pseudomonas chlororaphis subsp. aureofaciens]